MSVAAAAGILPNGMVADVSRFDHDVSNDFALHRDVPLVHAAKAVPCCDPPGRERPGWRRRQSHSSLDRRPRRKESAWSNTNGWDIIPAATLFPGDGMLTTLKPMPEAEGASSGRQRPVDDARPCANHGLGIQLVGDAKPGRNGQLVGRNQFAIAAPVPLPA